MKKISIKKIGNAIILLITFIAVRSAYGQNSSYINLYAPESGTQVHTACQYIKLLPGYQYTEAPGNYMKSYIDNTNMCNVTYLSGGAGFEENTPPSLNTTSAAVGTMNGTFNVDQNGAATYNISLVIPPGTMGMVPNLSLDYNSNGGNGLLGTGWSLGGLSAISRTSQNFYNDGETTPVTYTNADRFTLDGSRLILVAPTATSNYGLDVTVYHTENESFQKVISHGQTSGGSPLWFEVDTKDGKTLQYGYTTDSRIMACGSTTVVQTWLLNSVTDNRGNYMTIQYTQDNVNCQYYPASIQYTGNAGSSPVITPYNEITFSYALRGDPQTTYTAGYQENQNVLLTGIQMYAQNTLVHHYQLDYSLDALYSHLVEITEYGSDESAYNSTKINYHNNLSNPSAPATNLSVSGLATDNYYSIYHGSYSQADGILPRFLLCGDFSGDGITSIVEEEPLPAYPIGYNGVNWNLFSETSGPSAFSSIASGSNPGALCGYLNNGGIAYFSDDGDPIPTDPEYGFSTAVPPLDMNGDGKDDMVFFVGSLYGIDSFYVFYSNGTGFNNTPIKFTGDPNDGVIGPFIPLVGDFDGDGVDDLVVFFPLSGDAFMYSIKNGTPVQKLFPGTSILNAVDCPPGYVSLLAQKSAYAIDINGDGRKEILITGNNYTYIYNLNCDGSYTSPVPGIPKTYTNFGTDPYWWDGISPSTASVYPGDFNGDGKTDLLIYNNTGGYSYFTGQAGAPTNNWYIAYSNGTDFGPFEPATFMNDNGPAYGYPFLAPFGTHQYYVADINGDGKDDIVDQGWVYNFSAPQVDVYAVDYDVVSSMTLDLYFGNGNATAGSGAFVHESQTESGLTNDLGPINQTLIGDFNGDGHQSMLVYNTALGTSQLYSFDLNNQPDDGINKAIAISNGLNATTNIYYNSLPDMSATGVTTYNAGSGATFPVQDVTPPTYVVSYTQQDNGNGTQNIGYYSYTGALNHIQGKGFMGFTSWQDYDYTSGLADVNSYQFSNAYFDQQLLSTESFVYSSGIPIDSKTYSYNTINNPTSIETQSYSPNSCNYPSGNYYYDIHYNYPSQVIDDNQLYGLYTTSTSQEDLYGNITQETGNNTAQTYTTTTTYTTETNTGWGGLLPVCAATYTTTTQRPSQSPYTRSAAFTYNSYGQLTQRTDDIGLMTSCTYDDASANVGNLSQVAFTGDFVSRSYSYTYDSPYRRFVIQQTIPIGYTTATYDNAYGNPLITYDLNHHPTTYSYDGFGRVTQMNMPTGEQVTASRLWDNVGVVPNSLFYAQVSATGETTQSVYYDKLGKALRNHKIGFSSVDIFQDMTYYNNQLPETVSEPHYSAGTPSYNTYSYDSYLRPSSKIDVTGLNTNYSYTFGSPTYTVVTSGTSPTPTKTFSQTFDASGLTTQATDDGGTLNYIYASCGKVKSISIPGTGQYETITYDAYGRPTNVTDPDIGATTYTYDDLNEILNATDPTSDYQQTYDAMGRVLSSSESYTSESNTYTYDITNGIGMLGSVTETNINNVLGTPETNTVTCAYTYDNYSRVASKTETGLGSYPFNKQSSYLYDNLNRVTQITYPDGLIVNQAYDGNGYLSTINANNSMIWECTTMNQFDEITDHLQGDVYHVSHYYDSHGFLTNILAAEPLGPVMAYTYSFNDQTGNLTSRIDGLNHNTEDFTYDNLDRLTETSNSGPPGNVTLSYNTGGTIASKSDIGNFNYSYTQPHALSAVTSPTSIAPTDIQNMPLMGLYTLRYTPFKKISVVQEGSSPNQFETDYIYGPDHQRKVSLEYSNASLVKKVIYGDNYENVTAGSSTYDVDYIYAPDGLIALAVNSAINYAHTDHLGSIINLYGPSITGNSYNQSFDAWGNYRDPGNWTYVPSNTVVATYTNTPTWLIRGYTGHEQLRDFGLINMNGRAYDPLFGQMMSPDPNTQFPGFSQGYQRYSYCTNNPLKYTDPTGYDDDEGGKNTTACANWSGGSSVLGTIGSAISTAVTAIGNGVSSAINFMGTSQSTPEQAQGLNEAEHSLASIPDAGGSGGSETTSSKAAPPSDFYDKNGNLIKHVNDNSTAMYKQTGSGVSLHYELFGFDPLGSGLNIANLQTAEEEQQILNVSNPALQQDAAGNTFCNYGTQNVFSTLASASTNGQFLLSILGTANSMVNQLKNSPYFDQGDATAASYVGDAQELAILGYYNPNGHGHVATFSTGNNANTGIIANIGPTSRTGFVGIGPGNGQVFTTQGAASAATYFFLKAPLIPISVSEPPYH